MKISVITTCYNAASSIRDCLESVKKQTHGPIEHIVVDAASNDGTLAVVEEYKDSLDRVVSEPDNGIYDDMNKGLRLATGDVVGILNADDVYFGHDILANVAKVFENGLVESCYGDLVYVRGQNGCQASAGSCQLKGQGATSQGYKIVRYWKSGEFDSRKFYWGWMPPHPTFFVKREVYEKYGFFNLAMGTAADYELMLRFLVRRRISCAYLPETLIQMRVGGASNETFAARLKANRMDRKAWEMNEMRPYPWTLLMKPLRKVGQWFSRPWP